MRLAIMKLTSILLIFNCISVVIMMNYEKPLAEKVWRQRCVRNALVLNDCNWCWCNSNFRYTCDARVCNQVDMFGHFNDAIQDINVGMEGHGVWRNTKTACEPGVHYTRSDILCVCTEDGTWPNPICRDTFRVLHDVELVNDFKISSSQKCSPSKLYLADCNVCFCPSTGRIDPILCTKNDCSMEDFQEISTNSGDHNSVQDIYAQCVPHKNYQLDCKSCTCLRNNRLHCDNCTEDSECAGREAGEIFNLDCNTCYCNERGKIICTNKICIEENKNVETLRNKPTFRSNSISITDLQCKPGTNYRKDCNTCYCFQTKDNTIKFGCTLKRCNTKHYHQCELGSKYRKHCLKCRCDFFKGKMMEICETIPHCHDFTTLRLKYPVHECEPKKVYKKGCNFCQCLPDGKSVTCTDNTCKRSISVDVIPVTQKIPYCPKGTSYKIDCNFCFCLANGDALCTTVKCNRNALINSDTDRYGSLLPVNKVLNG